MKKENCTQINEPLRLLQPHVTDTSSEFLFSQNVDGTSKDS